MALEDTIAAISTPPGGGGIGIVRMSGPGAVGLARRVFRSPSGKNIEKALSHTVHYGFVHSGEKMLDEVLLTVMRAPSTYTREDIVEINCHGGIIPLKNVLKTVISLGARLAEPGEFTKRAFLNGRIDLSQAEAVADMVYAKTTLAGEAAISQLRGDIRASVEQIISEIACMLSEVEAAIDFPEEDIPGINAGRLGSGLERLIEKVDGLVHTAEAGIILREGLAAAIIGRPNVGKSSLFNAIAGSDRSIVTPAAGTTRDVIEATVSVDGIPVIFSDTAGMAEKPGDPIEEEAVRRSFRRSGEAGLLLLVIDGSRPVSREDMVLIESVKSRRAIIVLSKCDLPLKTDARKLDDAAGGKKVIKTSAVNHGGLEDLKNAISAMVWTGKIEDSEGVIAVNARHLEALKKAGAALRDALDTSGTMPAEVTALNLREAADAMREITGEKAGEDVLSAIFSRFCIGK